MISYYKTVEGQMQPIHALQTDCWIAVEEPIPEEIEFLVEELGVRQDYIKAALDRNETSYVKSDDTQTLIIIESPLAQQGEESEDSAMFKTLPVGFIVFADHIVTITEHASHVLQSMQENKIEGVDTADETSFVLGALHALVGRYIYYLRQIEELTLESEKNLKTATKNEEILKLLNLQKSLVFFSTALTAIQSVLDMIRRGNSIPMEDADFDLLENTQIELKQAVEQATIYGSILSTMMDAFGSVISNNVNTIMKIMTAVTIVMTVPNMVFGFYGMNVGLPLPFVSAPILITLLLMALVAYFLYRHDFFGE